MDTRVLSNVQRMQTKSKRTYLAKQWLQDARCEPYSFVLDEASAQNFKVLAKFRSTPICHRMLLLLARISQALAHHDQHPAISFGNWSTREFRRLGKYGLVFR